MDQCDFESRRLLTQAETFGTAEIGVVLVVGQQRLRNHAFTVIGGHFPRFHGHVATGRA